MTDQKILFVDDDPNILTHHSWRFGKRYAISLASNGQEALDTLQSQGPFAVVVADLKMPGMDGIELLKRIKELSPDTVRVLFTGYGDIDNAVEAVNQGNIFRFLRKPCSPMDMERTVSAALEQHALVQTRYEVHSLRRLQQAMEGMVLGFCRLVEARDPYTAGHQKRVADLSVSIAQQLGLAADSITGLRLAATVHDIGKMYVPAEFLNKPGKLTSGEYAIIKAHPQVGSDILAPIGFDWPISEIVLQHHERLDGSGYPRGLVGEAILMEARILAVADVVDAMESHRPYRPSLGRKATLTEITSQRGVLFDSDVVDACLHCVDDAE